MNRKRPNWMKTKKPRKAQKSSLSIWVAWVLKFFKDENYFPRVFWVQSLSHVQLFATPWTTACQASLSITNSWSLPKCMAIEYPPALNLSQHQNLFKWVSSSHQVAKVLEFQLQHQSFQWTPRTDLLQDGLVGSPCIPRDSLRVFSNITVQKHKFFSAQLSSQSNPHIHTWPQEKP